MKIAYMISEISCTNGAGDGVRTQAWTWADGLRKLGVDVTMVSPWDRCDFGQYDLAHMFSYYAGMEMDITQLKRKYGTPVVISPIIDSNRSPILTRVAATLHSPLLHLYSPAGSIKRSGMLVDGWFVRSEYERKYIQAAYGIPSERIYKVMLSTRLPISDINSNREDFCLLVSYMPSVRKNVVGLIDSAIKYKFNLKLAGGMTNPKAYSGMLEKIAPYKNIEALGFVSDNELMALYRRARVFALPSFTEGVGLVALEAAANGCDIVLTNRGAPKEYYNGMAALVDPASIDEIGTAVCEFMQGKTYQPQLKRYIEQNYSLAKSSKDLLSAYYEVLKKAKN